MRQDLADGGNQEDGALMGLVAARSEVVSAMREEGSRRARLESNG
jgi:hypothetical protein